MRAIGRARKVLLVPLPAGLLALYLALSPIANPLTRPQPAASTADPAEAVPGELLIKYRQPMFTLGRRIVNNTAGAKEIDEVGEVGVSEVTVNPDVSMDEAASRYRSLSEVEYAEPNIIFHTQMTPNDPLYSGRQQWYYDLIGAPRAWDIEMGQPNVIIAILDTGVDVTHPDLSGNIWTNPNEIPGNGIDDDGNGCVDDVHGCNFAEQSAVCAAGASVPNGDVSDENGHGTFVAGIAAAEGNNGIGVIGMAPNARIMPVKVLDCQGSGTALAATPGLLYAAKSGAKVINLSFGADQDSATLSAAIGIVHDTYGVTIVAAAGNSGQGQVSFPARDSRVIAVSASDHQNPDSKASFSNWGPEVSVSVPGVDITSTVPSTACGGEWACLNGQPYAMGTGTSFSAPLVAGAAALILSKGPPVSPDGVKNKLMSTAVDLPDGAYPHWDGAGRIQADLALQGKSYQLGVAGIVKN
jgi:subtilisin family serine protease